MNNQLPNDHAENIKKSIESIIGADTTLKRRKKTEYDLNREKFELVIRTLEEVEVRSILLEEDFKLGFSKYDDKFFTIIDILLRLYLGEDAFKMIEFYLYERINPDGTRNNLYDENKNLVPLETPGDLWDLIHIMKEKLQKKTK